MIVSYSSLTEKQLSKLPRSEYKKVSRKIKLLSADPYLGKKLIGELNALFSLKAWPYRIIYQIAKKEGIVLILKVEHRQGVYK